MTTTCSSASRRSPSGRSRKFIPIGVYFLRPDVFEVIEQLVPSARGEFEITDVLNHYLRAGGIFWRRYEGQWTDAGTVDSLMVASRLAADDAERGLLRIAARRGRPAMTLSGRERCASSRRNDLASA